MPAEKKDGYTGADNANADSANIFAPPDCFPDRSGPDQLSVLSRGQNPGGPLRGYSLERTSEFAIRPAYRSSSPVQKPASRNRAAPGVRAAAALPSRWGGYKAAGPREIARGPRSHGKYCLI